MSSYRGNYKFTFNLDKAETVSKSNEFSTGGPQPAVFGVVGN